MTNLPIKLTLTTFSFYYYYYYYNFFSKPFFLFDLKSNLRLEFLTSTLNKILKLDFKMKNEFLISHTQINKRYVNEFESHSIKAIF